MSETDSSASTDVLVKVRLPAKVWRAVEQSAAAQGCSRTEALRRAISTDAFRLQMEREGAKLIVEHASGTCQVVEWRFDS